MAMGVGTQRSKALRNFTMPHDLRWGNRRFLRCIKVNSNDLDPLAADISYHRRGNISVQHPRSGRGMDTEILNGSLQVPPIRAPSDRRPRFRDAGADNEDGIAASRQKVMFDLRTAADEMKDAFFRDGFEEGKVSGSPPPPTVEAEVQRPWNLRTRRAACKTPITKFHSFTNIGAAATTSENDAGADGSSQKIDATKPNSLNCQKKPASGAAPDKSPRPTIGEKREGRKFSVTLSKSDIEEDYLEMVGRRPPRRPRKRTRTIRRQLDSLFPGLWLTEVTPDMYKVSEPVF